MKSGEAEKYLEETKYEATKFFDRVSISRTSNKQLLPSNIHICVHSVHALTKESMEQLVVRANGKVVHSLREADIVVSKTPLDTDKVVVNENWLFYCIEQWKCKFFYTLLLVYQNAFPFFFFYFQNRKKVH